MKSERLKMRGGERMAPVQGEVCSAVTAAAAAGDADDCRKTSDTSKFAPGGTNPADVM